MTREQIEETIDKILDAADEGHDNCKDIDISIHDVLRKHDWGGISEEVFLYMCNIALENSDGTTIESLSTKYFNYAPDYFGEQLVFKNGYVELLQTLARDVDVQLNTKVTSIDYSGSTVTVTDENSK
jgi:hypothetical protein